MKDDDQYAFANHLVGLLDKLIFNSTRSASYLARMEIERLLKEIKSDPKRLEPFGYKIYSQNDEDGIIAEIFNRLGISQGVFCEIGVENGLECNTLLLIHKGWKGVWLEGNPAQEQPIKNLFKSILDSKRLAIGIEFLTPHNINEIISKYLSSLRLHDNDIDFLSIDIDGMDIYLLEALTLMPKVICIEYNSKFPPPLSKKPLLDEKFMWDGTDYMGSSLAAINESAEIKGYTLVGTNLTGLNAFFVRNDLLGKKFVDCNNWTVLYNPPRYYLTYDQYAAPLSSGHPPGFGPYSDLL